MVIGTVPAVSLTTMPGRVTMIGLVTSPDAPAFGLIVTVSALVATIQGPVVSYVGLGNDVAVERSPLMFWPTGISTVAWVIETGSIPGSETIICTPMMTGLAPATDARIGLFDGTNAYASARPASLTIAGLLPSAHCSRW